MCYDYRGSVSSDLGSIEVFIRNLMECLDDVIADESLMFDVRLIINELVLNGCIHGNHYRTDKQVDLAVRVDDDHIVVNVSDEGVGVGSGFETLDPADLRCDGRGLYLVQKLSDRLIIDANRVTAIINKD